MTIIQDDPDRSTPGERPDAAATRISQAGDRTEDATRRFAAAIAGALEGFIEALDRYDVANEGRRAVENAGAMTRAAAVEGKTQAHTPEMQQLKRGAQAAGEKAGEIGHDAGQAVHDAVESTKFAAYRAKEEVKVRAEAVAESGRRARLAPGHIVHEIGEAFAAWRRALVISIAMMLALATFVTTALIVLTIALVVGLNEAIGDPTGTFVVALIYLVVAGIAFAVSKSARMKAAREREERMENVREEVRHVTRPVREAFGRRGTY